MRSSLCVSTPNTVCNLRTLPLLTSLHPLLTLPLPFATVVAAGSYQRQVISLNEECNGSMCSHSSWYDHSPIHGNIMRFSYHYYSDQPSPASTMSKEVTWSAFHHASSLSLRLATCLETIHHSSIPLTSSLLQTLNIIVLAPSLTSPSPMQAPSEHPYHLWWSRSCTDMYKSLSFICQLTHCGWYNITLSDCFLTYSYGPLNLLWSSPLLHTCVDRWNTYSIISRAWGAGTLC